MDELLQPGNAFFTFPGRKRHEACMRHSPFSGASVQRRKEAAVAIREVPIEVSQSGRDKESSCSSSKRRSDRLSKERSCASATVGQLVLCP